MDPEYLEDPPAGIFAPVEMDKALDIAIVGAGIAGLAAAAGLLRSGHRVEVCRSITIHDSDLNTVLDIRKVKVLQ
jgi:2-polyprenyl-6-methoxyphenol hydroxylase-like FAD-dependent oxidoreductase